MRSFSMLITALVLFVLIPACHAQATVNGPEAEGYPILTDASSQSSDESAVVPDGHWAGNDGVNAPSPYPAECGSADPRKLDLTTNAHICACGEGAHTVWWSWYEVRHVVGTIGQPACPPPDQRQPLHSGPVPFGAEPPRIGTGTPTTPALPAPPPALLASPPTVTSTTSASKNCNLMESNGKRTNACESVVNGAKVSGTCVGASFLPRRFSDVEAYTGGAPCTCPEGKSPEPLASTNFPNTYQCPQDKH